VELSLETDGSVAALKVRGDVTLTEASTITEYLRVARENGALRCVVDLSACTALPTTIVAVLMREQGRFATSGGTLALAGVGEQNPFLTQSVAAGRFGHYRTVEEGLAAERRASGAPFDAPSGGT
jgi:anti-anti-sigma regulatory factor